MAMTEHQRNQYRHEIKWLEREIQVLASRVVKKPRVQRQIDQYRHEIKHREYQISLGL